MNLGEHSCDVRRLRLHQKLASSNVVWYLNTATVLKLLDMNLCRFLGRQYDVENSVHLDCAQGTLTR